MFKHVDMNLSRLLFEIIVYYKAGYTFKPAPFRYHLYHKKFHQITMKIENFHQLLKLLSQLVLQKERCIVISEARRKYLLPCLKTILCCCLNG